MLKTALTAALVFGSVSVALATEYDSNEGNRFPQASVSQAFEGRNVALSGSQNVIVRTPMTDRAGSPYAGGGF